MNINRGPVGGAWDSRATFEALVALGYSNADAAALAFRVGIDVDTLSAVEAFVNAGDGVLASAISGLQDQVDGLTSGSNSPNPVAGGLEFEYALSAGSGSWNAFKVDSSGNGLSLTGNSANWNALSGKLVFNGGQHAFIPVSFGGFPLSIAFVVRVPVGVAGGTIIGGDNTGLMQLRIDGPRFQLMRAGAAQVSASDVIPSLADGVTWRCVIVTHDAAGNVRWYLNTAPIGSSAGAVTGYGGGGLRLGEMGGVGESGTFDLAYLSGYSRALTSGEVSDLYAFIQARQAAKGIVLP